MKAFGTLKSLMCHKPVLIQPNFDKHFYLQTDASAYGVGTILLQAAGLDPDTEDTIPPKNSKPKLHPVAHYSATFTPMKRNYDIYERELLAVMKSLTHWRHYLGWTKFPFIILTDHANLQYWKAPKNLNRRTAQWHADLQEYDFVIHHIPKKANMGPDILSRPPNMDQGKGDNQDVVVLPQEKFIRAITIGGATETQKWDLMVLVHNHPTAGHPGRDETTRQAKNCLSWPEMTAWIAQYIKGCATCQQNKNLTHQTKIPLYHISIPPDALPFQQIAMDLITGLPRVRGKDVVLMIVNHGCSRAAVFLPCATTIMGLGIAALYLKNIYPWFGLPRKIITDRDPQFTSHFGQALTARIGVQQNIFTAFHPQIDGLSERKNQWVEQYLRIVTSAAPEDWTEWLSITTVVHNDQQNTTTGLSPNQILWGHEAILVHDGEFPSRNQTAADRMDDLQAKRKLAIMALNEAAGAVPALSPYKEGYQVWLEATHLCLPYQSTKLAPKHHGPFVITKRISLVAFKLRLPAAWTIHNIFHASLLSPYHESKEHGPNYSRPPPDLLEGEEEYKVECIINHQFSERLRTLQYLIKWKGYPDVDNTWELATQVHAPELVNAYHRLSPLETHKRGPRKPRKSIRSSLLLQHMINQLCLPTPEMRQTNRPPRQGLHCPLPL